MQKVKIPLEVMNKLLSYLGNKPYIEVFELIKVLTSNIEPVKEEDKQE